MSTTFELEAQVFARNFSEYTEKRIVLYGIGRRTATLIEQNDRFNFIGLMDRDINNIGRILYGLPVLSLSEAEKIADMIIINAPETYWKVIYKRILNSKIPVYFTNGKLAQIKEETCDSNNPYWEKDEKRFIEQLKDYEVISFDMFDTLVSRRVLRAEDVFEIVEKKINASKIMDCYVEFVAIRNQAINKIGKTCYSINDIYDMFHIITGWDKDIIDKFKRIEFEVEKNLLRPRKKMIEIYSKMVSLGKEIYIVTDMYYSKNTLAKLLEYCGLLIDEKKIIVSCEQKVDKRKGELWKFFKKNIVGQRKAIHIGDNLEADVRQPQQNGIDTYYIMAIRDMLRESSIKKLDEKVTNVKESLLVGEIITQLFDNPFQLSNTKGKLCFDSREIWGYCVWGPIIFSFVQWLIKQSSENGINQFVFFARDGYLIQKDYDYFCKLTKDKKAPISDYLYISRRIAYIADIQNEKDFAEWLNFPYIGKFREFLFDRFGVEIAENNEYADIEIQMPNDRKKVQEWIIPYIENIKLAINTERENYLRFLDNRAWNDKFAVVDIGYHGNIQRKLGRILKKDLIGFYFYSDLSLENQCCKQGKMIPCFQIKGDLKADSTSLFRYPQLLESLFTAPYGMIMSIDSKGNKISGSMGKNQKYFPERLEINEGIRKFLRKIVDLSIVIELKEFYGEEKFVDDMFGILFENSIIASDISKIFYWDDAIVQRRENEIFS